MSQDEVHGGEGWSYKNCVWAPTVKRKGRGSWPFWSKILTVKEGDVIVHLRGKREQAFFEGYSFALGDGYETRERPPRPGRWSYSKRFYRADLIGFTPFDQPIRLWDVFAKRRRRLERYFDKNKTGDHRNIFLVWQAGRLQCLNGAYFSEIDEDLWSALFGIDSLSAGSSPPSFVSVKTGQQLSLVSARLGQAAFSREIRALYRGVCCFPMCRVADRRFLVASHIASVLNQKFATFYHVLGVLLYLQKRSMDARMSSADFVHLKGFGLALWRAMKEAISARRALTLR